MYTLPIDVLKSVIISSVIPLYLISKLLSACFNSSYTLPIEVLNALTIFVEISSIFLINSSLLSLHNLSYFVWIASSAASKSFLTLLIAVLLSDVNLSYFVIIAFLSLVCWSDNSVFVLVINVVRSPTFDLIH